MSFMMDELSYDFHIHSCLSACAEDEMTPANIAGFARLEGISWISVTDHNSADNLPAVQKACKAYGLGFLPGIEVTSAEEIHLLCYFKELEAALDMSAQLSKVLPPYPYDREIFGNQWVMDEEDRVLAEPPHLLSAAVSWDIYEVRHRCEALGGMCVPAHVNREANSMLSVLGTLPEDFACPIVEWIPFDAKQSALQSRFLQEEQEILTSSDAHCLANIGLYKKHLKKESRFYSWLLA